MSSPVIFIHGSGVVNLANHHAARYRAVASAGKALSQLPPNARDYDGPDAFREARSEHDALLSTLRTAEDGELAILSAFTKASPEGLSAVDSALNAITPGSPGRTDREIVDQTNELARKFYKQRGYTVPADHKFYEERVNTHPHEREVWAAACMAQELLTGTDPRDALDNLEAEAS